MNADGQLLFEIRDLCKSFGDIEVLKNINTTISQGEVVVIVGPSGSGKSTFLRSLNLLEEPTGGQILFEGKDITDPKANINLYRQHIGMVFQHFNLFPHKTILQNMTLAPVQLLKRSKKEAEEEAMKLLEREYAKELKILNITLPKTDKIPAVRFDKAKELVAEKYNRKIRNPFDLEPEEETLIGQYFKEEYDADFVFVTHYPSKKRPFYAMDDPEDSRFTLSFDLLYHGLEITTGGQRIHDYNMLVEKIAAKGMDQEGLEQYLDTFRYGMPPHGGLGIGMERLTMKLVGEDNVRETTLYPRDLSRLEP